MSEPNTTKQIEDAFTFGAIGFGAVAIVMPRVMAAVYGLTGNPNVRFLGRLWGTRTAALGILAMLTDRDEDRRRFMTVATAMNGLDALIALRAGPEVSARGKLLSAATSGSFAAAGAYALSQG